MARNVSYEQFRGELTEGEMAELLALARKRRRLYLICNLLYYPVGIALGFIFMAIDLMVMNYILAIPMLALGVCVGFGVYTNNVIAFLASKGQKEGGGFLSILWAIIGGILVPIVVIFVCNRVFPYKSVLGWGKAGIEFRQVR